MRSLYDILETCLDEIDRGASSPEECLHRYEEFAPGLAPLLAAAERYRRAPAVQPSPAFREAARARMLNLVAASASPTKSPALTSHRASLWPGRGLAAALLRVGLALIVIFALAGGTTVAAAAALPDSPLYLVKLALEEARLMATWSNADRIELRLTIAERRAQELMTMAQSRVSGNLDEMTSRYELTVRATVREAMGPGVAPSVLRTVDAGLALQQQRLQAMLAQLDAAGPEARASLGQALGILQRERAELRLRIGEGTPAPPGGPNASPEPERHHQELGPLPAVTPQQERYRQQEPAPSVTPQQERNRQQSPAPYVTPQLEHNGQPWSAPTPEPERYRQQWPTATPAAATPTPKATSSTPGGEPGGQGGCGEVANPSPTGGSSGWRR